MNDKFHGFLGIAANRFGRFVFSFDVAWAYKSNDVQQSAVDTLLLAFNRHAMFISFRCQPLLFHSAVFVTSRTHA
jgi:hypothetical protein